MTKEADIQERMLSNGQYSNRASRNRFFSNGDITNAFLQILGLHLLWVQGTTPASLWTLRFMTSFAAMSSSFGTSRISWYKLVTNCTATNDRPGSLSAHLSWPWDPFAVLGWLIRISLEQFNKRQFFDLNRCHYALGNSITWIQLWKECYSYRTWSLSMTSRWCIA